MATAIINHRRLVNFLVPSTSKYFELCVERCKDNPQKFLQQHKVTKEDIINLINKEDGPFLKPVTDFHVIISDYKPVRITD